MCLAGFGPGNEAVLQFIPPKGDVAQRQGDTLKGRRAAQPSAACGRCSEAEQGQPSKFSSEPRSAQKIWQTATRRREGRFSCALPPYREPFISFPFYSLRWARGGGRGFRFPLPTPSGLPTHPNDQGLNPGPKRGSRSVQRPKKHSHACPWKLQRSPNGGTGVFLDGLCPLLRFYMRPLFAGAARLCTPLKAPETPRPTPQKSAKRKRIHIQKNRSAQMQGGFYG